jgi:hypothetical protein
MVVGNSWNPKGTHRHFRSLEERYINDVFERLKIFVTACCPDGIQQSTAVGLKTFCEVAMSRHFLR